MRKQTSQYLPVLIVGVAMTVYAQTPQPGAPTLPATNVKTQPTAAQFTIGEQSNMVRLLGPTTVVSLAATVTGLEKLAPTELENYGKSLVVADKGAVRGASLTGTVQFDRPEFIGRSGASGLMWRIAVTASGFVGGTTQVRHA